MLRVLLVVLLIAMLVLGASIGYFNAQTVHFNYLFGELELPLIAILVGDFLLGMLVTLLLVAARLLRAQRDMARLRRQLRDAESELRNLRALPVAAPVVAVPPPPAIPSPTPPLP
ncbi:MAG TPA: LapA family protein [Solimonas sp.]